MEKKTKKIMATKKKVKKIITDIKKEKKAVKQKKETKATADVENTGISHKLFEHVAKKAELDQYIDWTAMPSMYRKPETQYEFAKQYGVSEDILTRWKKRDGFYDEVSRRRKIFFRHDAGDVVMALKRKCLKEGNGSDVKIFLNYAGELTDKQEMVVDPELKDALKKISSILPD